MRVATWENNRLVFQTDPFSVHHLSNEITFFHPSDSLQEVALYAKFKLGEENLFRDRMIGGVIEASNHPGFREKDTLHVVNEVPGRLNTSVVINTDKAYRYLRYYGPKGSHCNLSELAFYENINDKQRLKEKPSVPGDWVITAPLNTANV